MISEERYLKQIRKKKRPRKPRPVLVAVDTDARWTGPRLHILKEPQPSLAFWDSCGGQQHLDLNTGGAHRAGASVDDGADHRPVQRCEQVGEGHGELVSESAVLR
jgi:hypothetical protein